MLKEIRPALTLLLLLSLLTGILYPLLVTQATQVLFPVQANGSLLVVEGRTLGSRLIGQAFSANQYFWGRPSATLPEPYNATASGGSNLGPLNPALDTAVKARIAALKASNPTQTAQIPVDLVTASASGLDPHISVAAALWQVPRIAKARDIGAEELTRLIVRYTEARQWGILGEPCVNVLLLNLALDGKGD